jgi:hypothetical protein
MASSPLQGDEDEYDCRTMDSHKRRRPIEIRPRDDLSTPGNQYVEEIYLDEASGNQKTKLVLHQFRPLGQVIESVQQKAHDAMLRRGMSEQEISEFREASVNKWDRRIQTLKSELT